MTASLEMKSMMVSMALDGCVCTQIGYAGDLQAPGASGQGCFLGRRDLGSDGVLLSPGCKQLAWHRGQLCSVVYSIGLESRCLASW